MPKFQFNNIIDSSSGTGRVSPHSLLTRYAAVAGEEFTEAETETAAAIAGFDSDGDGVLEIAELERLVEAGEGEQGKEMKAAFEMYAMEGLGVITPLSLRRMLSRLGEPISVGDCKRMISKFDVNGDGVLCFHEFRVMMFL